MKKPFNPNFRTPWPDLCKEEFNKIKYGLTDNIAKEFADPSKGDISAEAEQLAKSHGVYLEFNRALTGEEKDWMYLIRVSLPGGGPITRDQWRLFDDLSEKYGKDPEGHSSLRFTTRQNIQFHWVKKPNVLKIIKTLAEAGKRSLNGCGDNTRNVMACPLSRYSDIFNANLWAQKTGAYFQLPLQPYIEVWGLDPAYIRKPEASFAYGPNLLNRKFKIGYSTVHRDPQTGKILPDNCVEFLTNDMAIAPIVENNEVSRFQVYVGGGQGERNGKPSTASLAQPLGIVPERQLMAALDAVVKVHQEYGDRQNRWWARVKYTVKKMGIGWYREQVEGRLGFKLADPNPDHDYGDRDLHFGWTLQPINQKYAYGAFLENGRLTDASPNGKLKTMVRELMEKYPVDLMITPNQDALFTNIPPEARKDFEADLKKYKFGLRDGKPYSTLRLCSGACVGRDTCRLTYTDSEKFEPFLIDELEKMGWGETNESIGITGCERQCFRPATKTIGLVGSGFDRYQFKLMGSESARTQGVPVISSDGESMYLRSVPREKVAIVIDALFKFHKANAKSGEDMGAYHHRIGLDAIIKHLKENPATSELMQKPMPTDCVIE
jgi:sulfite reductase (NADPH) hemoprotein beta-component